MHRQLNVNWVIFLATTSIAIEQKKKKEKQFQERN